MGDANSGAITYWQANTRDAEHRLTGFRQGNGLVTLKDYDPASGHQMGIQTGFEFGANLRELEYHYDALDNVTSRHDRVQGVSESFQYDSLDRLKQNSVSGSVDGVGYNYATDYDYDLTGNILYKSDVGHYSYGNAARTSGNAGPAALLSAGTGHTAYQYDLNGNLENGGGRVFQWTSFNKPHHLQKGTAWTDFTYGPDRARYLKTTSTGETTVYIGKLYEEITEGTKTTRKHFIYAGGELAAIQIKTVDNGITQPDQTRYLHTDALGSVDTITDGFGNIVDRMGFDPFGMRRAGNWNRGLPLELPALTNRGFTGHEHLDDLGIIHMNGRIYDPELGRFLSADPTIQSPLHSQSHNRYSYVWNNPLKYTDPSGFFLKKLIRSVKKFVKKYGRAILAIGAAFLTGGAALAAMGYEFGVAGFLAAAEAGKLGALVIAGAAGGFASGLVSTGSINGALKGALYGGVSALFAGAIGAAVHDGTMAAAFGSFDKFAANTFHGLSQGLISEAFGGDFKSGFIGAFVGHSIGGKLKQLMPNDVIGRTMAAAVTGGLASAAGGGKFANGAVSGAFAHLFNTESGGLTQKDADRIFNEVGQGLSGLDNDTENNPSRWSLITGAYDQVGGALADYWYVNPAVLVGTGGTVGALAATGRALTVTFRTGHYAVRLERVGLDVARVESFVAREVAGMEQNLTVGASFGGRATVDGVLIEYRAMPLGEGVVNVGTIFPVK